MIFTTIAKAKKQTGLSYLGGINISSKMIKNKKVSGNYTYIIYLAPANQSGYNVCLFSTPECRLGCLATSGRASMELHSNGIKRIQNARITKSKLFFQKQDFFMQWMIAEIKMYQKKALKDGYEFSVRLNGTSDIDYTRKRFNGMTIFEHFPETMFYDYTKQITKFSWLPNNYDLTFSYSGHNVDECKMVLESKMNIAVVFDVKKGKALPETFMGYPVVDGDLTDARFLDEKGVVIGLRFKKIADKEAESKVLNSVFVVKPYSTNL